jgi:two-component system sensor histidine kinase RpfC
MAARQQPYRHKSLVDRLKSRLAARPDTEHEQALIRIGFALLIASYIVIVSPLSGDSSRFLVLGLSISFGALVLSVLVFLHILWRPGVSVVRRVAGMLVDTGGVNGVMLVGGMTAAPFYPILLWIIFGHGFRFGRPYLFASAGMSLLLFGLVVLLNPDWRRVPALDVALIMALVVLPAYVSVLLRKLEQAIRRAEDANQAKSRFLAVMSHEFRTPLNAVIGLSDLLRQDERDDDRREMLGTVRTAAGTILSLVDAVLDAAKIEAGKFMLVHKPFDLHGLLGVLRGMLEPQAQARGLWLRLVLDPKVPPHLSGDMAALQQVLTNLVANALKFTETGGVTLRVRRAALADGGSGIGFVVEDTGIGIPAEVQARIFESFTQAEDTTNRVHGGTGLGLTIAKELVELMGGRLALASAPGQGASFGFALPLAPATDADLPPLPLHGSVVVLGQNEAAALAHAAVRAAGLASQPAADLATAVLLLRRGHGRRLLVLAGPLGEDPAELALVALRRAEGSVDIVVVQDAAQPAPAFALAALPQDALADDLPVLVRAALAPHQAQKLATQQAPARAAYPCRLLVAEDNLTNQQVARRILEAAGHEVVIVGSGQDAVERVQVERFEAVLMDLNMPGMGGIEALKLLRFVEDDLPPVIALTADVTEATIAECKKVGFADYAMKPIDAPALLQIIDRHVQARRMAQGDEGAGSGAFLEEARQPIGFSPPWPAVDLAVTARPAAATPDSRQRILDPRRLEALAKSGEGDPFFLIEIIELFAEEAEEIVVAIRQAARQENVVAMRQLTHKLAGSAASIGAVRLHDLLLSWQGLADGALLADDGQVARQVETEVNLVVLALRAWKANQDDLRYSA